MWRTGDIDGRYVLNMHHRGDLLQDLHLTNALRLVVLFPIANFVHQRKTENVCPENSKLDYLRTAPILLFQMFQLVRA